MADAMHFDSTADFYDQARPSYPSSLWNRIRERGLLVPGHHVVDLGAGTGQATGPLHAAGMRVTAVEPGPRLAARLSANHPAATVLAVRAEEVELDDGSVDLVVAATSIHWMNLDVLLPRIHRALSTDGRFLVWRTVFGDPTAPVTPFRERIWEIVSARPRPASRGLGAGDVAETAEALTRTRLFAADEASTFRWRIELDDQQIRRLFRTFSDWTTDEVEEAAAAARDLGGTVAEHYSSWLLVLRPLPLVT